MKLTWEPDIGSHGICHSRVVDLQLERTIRMIMLVVASLGSAPLWVHHALSHQSADSHHGDTRCLCAGGRQASGTQTRPVRKNGCETACGDSRPQSSTCKIDANADGCWSQSSEATDDDQPGRDVVRHLDPGTHECIVCFQLSQSPSVALKVFAERSGLHVFRGKSWSDPVVLSMVACPPPARGPPTIC